MSNSPLTVTLVIVSLVVAAIGFGSAACYLAANKLDYSAFMSAATGAVGAITGLLAQTATHPAQSRETHEIDDVAKR